MCSCHCERPVGITRANYRLGAGSELLRAQVASASHVRLDPCGCATPCSRARAWQSISSGHLPRLLPAGGSRWATVGGDAREQVVGAEADWRCGWRLDQPAARDAMSRSGVALPGIPRRQHLGDRLAPPPLVQVRPAVAVGRGGAVCCWPARRRARVAACTSLPLSFALSFTRSLPRSLCQRTSPAVTAERRPSRMHTVMTAAAPCDAARCSIQVEKAARAERAHG